MSNCVSGISLSTLLRKADSFKSLLSMIFFGIAFYVCLFCFSFLPILIPVLIPAGIYADFSHTNRFLRSLQKL